MYRNHLESYVKQMATNILKKQWTFFYMWICTMALLVSLHNEIFYYGNMKHYGMNLSDDVEIEC